MKIIILPSLHYRYFFVSFFSLIPLLQASDSDEPQSEVAHSIDLIVGEKENEVQSNIASSVIELHQTNMTNVSQRKISSIDSSLGGSESQYNLSDAKRVQEYLSHLGIQSLEEAELRNINLKLLERELKRNYYQRWITWMTMDSWLRKAAVCLCVRNTHLTPPNKSSKDGCHLPLWPRNNALSYYSSSIRSSMITVEALEEAFESSIGHIWSLLLLLIKIDELHIYLAYPESLPPDTTFWSLVVRGGNQESVLHNLLSIPWMWLGILTAPSLLMGFKSLKSCYKSRKYYLEDDGIRDVLQYKPTSPCKQDTLCMYNPFANLDGGLKRTRLHVQQNSSLSLNQRRKFFDKIVYVSKEGKRVAQSVALDQLLEIGHGVGLSDFPKLHQKGVDVTTISSMISMKLDAIQVLKEMSVYHPVMNHVQPDPSEYQPLKKEQQKHPCTTCACLRGIYAQYNCWHLGHKTPLPLHVPFFALKSWKLYSKVTLLLAIYRAIQVVYENKKAERECRRAGKVWSFLPQIGTSNCSWCGDINVPYYTIYDAKACWDFFLSRTQSSDEIIKLIDRFDDLTSLGILDISLDQQMTDISFMANVFPLLLDHVQRINSLSFGVLSLNTNNVNSVMDVISQNATSCSMLQSSLINRISISNFSSNEVDAIKFWDCLPVNYVETLIINFSLPESQYFMSKNLLQSTSVRLLEIGFINKMVLSHLKHVYFGSKLNILALHNSKINDISGLVNGISHSNLNILALHENEINDTNELAVSLYNSSVTELYLYDNQISNVTNLFSILPNSNLNVVSLTDNLIKNISSLSKNLPKSKLKILNLGYNNIRDISAFAEGLSGSKLDKLILVGNSITDVSYFSKGLPSSILTELYLFNNQIIDITDLITILPQCNLKHLSLWGNQISNISALEQGLPGSGLLNLYLNSNYITDISSLGQSLPRSSLLTLTLWDNQISNISALAQALPSSLLNILDLSYNEISDIGPLAKGLPNSRVTRLHISENGISNINPLAEGLYGSNLEILVLDKNKIKNVSSLFKSIPSSKLITLSLSTNEINDISTLTQGLPNSNLTYLYLGENRITNISSLSEALPNSNLYFINLSSNKIGEINALSKGLPGSKLDTIWLINNEISDISPLETGIPSSQLTKIYLYNNSINNIYPLIRSLKKGTNLTTFDISGSPINDSTITALRRSLVKESPWWSKYSWFKYFLNSIRQEFADFDSTNPHLNSIVFDNYYFNKSSNFFSSFSTNGIKALCEILPATSLKVCDNNNPYVGSREGLCFGRYADDVDRNIVDPDTCYIPSYSHMNTPSNSLGIFFCFGLVLIRLLQSCT